MLSELQKTFSRHISDPAVDISREPENKIVFHPYSQDELQARLAIYRNNYYASLIEVLKDHFPTLLKLVGTDFFNMLCREYIQKMPPASPVLIDYGSGLPEFVEHFSDLNNFPYMADVARLDYLRHQAYYADDAVALRPDDFARYDVASLGNALIELHPSLRLLSSRFAVFSIWESNQDDSDEQVNAHQSETVLVYRHTDEIITCKLETGLFTFLLTLQQQCNFSQALEAALDIDLNFNPAEAVNYLISSGLSTKLTCIDIHPEHAR